MELFKVEKEELCWSRVKKANLWIETKRKSNMCITMILTTQTQEGLNYIA